MYASFANGTGGHEKVGHVKKDIYNQIARQRHEQTSNVVGAFKYFREWCMKDPMLFLSYTVDDDNKLQHLFWCDCVRK